MKHILTTSILVATAIFAQANAQSLTDKVRDTVNAVVDKTKEVAHDTKTAVVGAGHRAGRATREAWGKTKAYSSDEMPTYREGANEALNGLAKEIAEVKALTPTTAPSYFHTRLLALDEQQAYLSKSLGLLSPEQIRDRASGPRFAFDQCLEDLAAAIDQAKDGIGTLSVRPIE